MPQLVEPVAGCSWFPIEKDTEIRLLQIRPEKRSSEQIKCLMTVHRRESTPLYEAISYTWGDAVSLETIQCDGRNLIVRATCANALRALRRRKAASSASSGRPRYIWIDAICINQQDVAERNAQVALMGSIFRSAQRTVVYLGEVDKHSKWMQKYVFDKDENVSRYKSLDQRANHWKGFFDRPWFTRTWYA